MKLRLTVNVRDLPAIRQDANDSLVPDLVTDEEKVAWWLERQLTMTGRNPRRVQVIRVEPIAQRDIG